MISHNSLAFLHYIWTIETVLSGNSKRVVDANNWYHTHTKFSLSRSNKIVMNELTEQARKYGSVIV